MNRTIACFGVIAALIRSIEIFILYKSHQLKLVLIAAHKLPQQLLQMLITSSPGFKSNPIIAICKASVPFAHGMTCFTSKYSSNDFEIVVLADR
jgi:hypothetical protein